MRLFVSVKQAGKRKDYMSKKELVLGRVPETLRELVSELVRLSVLEYNKKPTEPLILDYLAPEDLENQAQTGKVGFAQRHNHKQADLKKAVDTALQAFQDGIYRVFIGETEVSSLVEPLTLKEGDVLTFIRLTMLAGRMW